MEINEKVIKIWSTIGPRAAFGMAALDFAKEYENLIILTCDVSTSAGLDRYRKTYPLKYLDLGINFLLSEIFRKKKNWRDLISKKRIFSYIFGNL